MGECCRSLRSGCLIPPQDSVVHAVVGKGLYNLLGLHQKSTGVWELGTGKCPSGGAVTVSNLVNMEALSKRLLGTEILSDRV